MALAGFYIPPVWQDTPSEIDPWSAEEWDDSPKSAETDGELSRQQLENDLIRVLVDAVDAGQLVSSASLVNASRFVAAMPPEWPSPTVLVEDDGEIAFDWVLSRHQMLTVSFGPTQQVGFSALVGRNPLYGKDGLSGPVPPIVADLMKRFRQEPV